MKKATFLYKFAFLVYTFEQVPKYFWEILIKKIKAIWIFLPVFKIASKKAFIHRNKILFLGFRLCTQKNCTTCTVYTLQEMSIAHNNADYIKDEGWEFPWS